MSIHTCRSVRFKPFTGTVIGEHSFSEVHFMYAIIATGGKQYKVSEGDVVRVEKLDAEVGSSYSFDQVLAVGEEGALVFGKPVVEGAVVKATVRKQARAKKVIVYKYKPKTGYHKKNGHRQCFTELKIDSITK
jgi:large subunit ribosomal protein L21